VDFVDSMSSLSSGFSTTTGSGLGAGGVGGGVGFGAGGVGVGFGVGFGAGGVPGCSLFPCIKSVNLLIILMILLFYVYGIDDRRARKSLKVSIGF